MQLDRKFRTLIVEQNELLFVDLKTRSNGISTSNATSQKQCLETEHTKHELVRMDNLRNRCSFKWL